MPVLRNRAVAAAAPAEDEAQPTTTASRPTASNPSRQAPEKM